MHISPTILKFKRPCVYLVVIIYLAFSVLLITHNFSSEYVQVKRNEPYREVVEDIKIFLDPKLLKLENLMDEDENLKSGKKQNIFFIETHMDGTRIIENARHACTIESAARVNPDANIYFILLTNETQVWLKYSELADVILGYDNVRIRFLNIYEFSKGTVLESLISSDAILKSNYPIEHMSDTMRALILTRYIAVYLDLDALSIVPIKIIGHDNFACPESLNRVANGIVKVSKSGQKVMDFYVKKISETYDSLGFSTNGPRFFTESLKNFCNGTDLVKENFTQCGDFTLMPTRKCYPIDYGGFEIFYKEDTEDIINRRVDENKSYFLHIWNKMNQLQKKFLSKLKPDSNISYIKIAERMCPRVLQSLQKRF